ncbi:unnamed protein product, partial [Nippostrongylus brasiliensis]|uniref:Uncharacterized protein n=1 Tax=Nippostrongylus brasiliensis TaxID=27835 RepID=A0A0N4YUD3_NIPBR
MVPLYPHFSCAMSGFLLNEVERSLQTFTIPSTVDGRELPDERIVPNTSNSFHVSTVHRWSNHPIVSRMAGGGEEHAAHSSAQDDAKDSESDGDAAED